MKLDDTIEFISRSIIHCTHDSSQGIIGKQIIGVSCSHAERVNQCNKCIELNVALSTKLYDTIDLVEISKMCDYICTCTISDVSIRSNIVCNFSVLMEDDTKQNLKQSMKLIWNEMMLDGRTTVVDTSVAENDDVLSSWSASVLDECRTTNFQSSVQEVTSSQNILLNGPGVIHAVNQSQMIHAVSKIIMSSKNMQNIATDITAKIITITSVLLKTVTSEIIMWIIRIVLYLVLIILLYIVFRSSLRLFVSSITI